MIYKMKNLFIAALLTSFSLTSLAQEKFKERIETAKVGVITNKLNLDETTATKFWPIYNTYSDALMNLKVERRTAMQTLRNMESASDADLDKALNAIIANEEKEILLRKKYKTEFARVLSVKQIAQLMLAEQEFKKMLLEKVGGGVRNNQEGGRRGRFFNR